MSVAGAAEKIDAAMRKLPGVTAGPHRAPSLPSSRRICGKRLNAEDYKLAVTSRYQNERFRRGSGGSISACARRISAVSGRSART